MLEFACVAPGEVGIVPTEDDVTCSIDAADEENKALQSAVGDSPGLVACGLKVHNNLFRVRMLLNSALNIRNIYESVLCVSVCA